AHYLYLSANSASSTGPYSIINNEFRRSGGSICQGVMFVAHGAMNQINIENNIVDGGAGANGGCYGIGLGHGGYPNACYFRNLTIRRNLLLNTGFKAISVEEAQFPTIENNVISSGLIASGYGIHMPANPARVSPPDDQTTGGVVRNNTIYVPSGGASNTIGILILDVPDGTNYVLPTPPLSF